MNISQFVAKWRKSNLTEQAASQEHFIDLCRAFDHPTPGDDGTGDDFTFERQVAKSNGRRGRADVWKRDFFAWEYKSKGKNLDDAHDQLRQYREALLNPPLLAACDMAILDIRTNFNCKATKQHLVPLRDLGATENRRVVELMFYEPKKLEPEQAIEFITKKAAGDLAAIAILMRRRGLDPTDVARFLDRVVFCLFAQDVRLLDNHVFTKIVEKTHRDPRWVSREIFNLFNAMNTGGECALERIPHFNGDLFADVRLLELEGNEIEAIHKVTRLDWGEVDASIIGTLFERGMDPTKETEIGTYYTGREDISTIVEPVVMAPLRQEWGLVRGEVDDLLEKFELSASPTKVVAKSPKKDSANLRSSRALIRDFLLRLQEVTILDPACGSGNFLFVSLQKLKDLEKEVLVYASERNIDGFLPSVGPWQLRGIEKSPYAYDLARMTVWIGWLQWTKANGYKVDWEPILGSLKHINNKDAIINLTDQGKPTDAEWPEAEFIVGNPPFLGGKKLRAELGDEYVDALFRVWRGCVRPEADLCCYWIEKARRQIEIGKCKRAGLLATQGIRGGANRESLQRIKQTGDIFFAESDRRWVLKGANVHVSMIGFDDGTEVIKNLDGLPTPFINSNLTAVADIAQARRLAENFNVGYMGDTKGGNFDIPEVRALQFVRSPNPNGRPNSDVLTPWINGLDVTRRNRQAWIIDFGVESDLQTVSIYEEPFEFLKLGHQGAREASRSRTRSWWLHERPRNEMRDALGTLPRFLVTATVSKHRLFVWAEHPTLADHQLIAFARSDDYFFGILHSRLHEVWALKSGTRLETRPRYTPTTCFETFPFPRPFAALEAKIATTAKRLDDLRSNWLNPPEWTREEVLEFPGSISGPWGQLVNDPDDRGVGTVRYTRRVPRDAECAEKLAGRTLTKLYNNRPTWLVSAHEALDVFVFEAYGWKPDLTNDEILSRLLALNLERASAEDNAPPESSRVKVIASHPSEHVD